MERKTKEDLSKFGKTLAEKLDFKRYQILIYASKARGLLWIVNKVCELVIGIDVHYYVTKSVYRKGHLFKIIEFMN